MRHFWLRVFASVAALLTVVAAPPPESQDQDLHFAWVDVYLDPAGQPLAAWQIDLRAVAGKVEIVGIEGGESPFATPPHYDPVAMRKQRVVLAAFSTAGELPVRELRVARVHLQVRGTDPEFSLELVAAATTGGKSMEVGTRVVPGRVK